MVNLFREYFSQRSSNKNADLVAEIRVFTRVAAARGKVARRSMTGWLPNFEMQYARSADACAQMKSAELVAPRFRVFVAGVRRRFAQLASAR